MSVAPTPKKVFDHVKRDRLLDLYVAAISETKSSFEFEGDTYDTGYAKYLLEYLNDRLGQTPITLDADRLAAAINEIEDVSQGVPDLRVIHTVDNEGDAEVFKTFTLKDVALAFDVLLKLRT